MTANVGITERADRLVAILVATGLRRGWACPTSRRFALWVLAAASTVTIAQRAWTVRRQAFAETPGTP